MNHKRWTCLTTAILTTLFAPMSAVYATIRPSKKPLAINRQISKIPSPSLPIITPLKVTELETDVAVAKKVAAVSKPNVMSDIDFIPPIEPQSPQFVPAKRNTPDVSQTAIRESKTKQVPVVAKLPNLSIAKVAQAPQFIRTDRPIPTTIAPQQRNSTIDRQMGSIGKLSSSKIPQNRQAYRFIPTQTPIAIQSGSKAISNSPQFKTIPNSPAVSLPIGTPKTVEFGIKQTTRQIVAYTRGTRLLTTDRQPILNSAIAEVEVPTIAPVVPSNSIVTELPEVPNFESGTPVFVFSGEQPRHIIATAIAQAGTNGKLAAPETSISIPVAPPKQTNTPTKSSTLQPTQVVPVTPIPVEPVTPVENVVATQTGQASWYGLEAGPKTANGERYNPKSLTAAHRSLPFGTRVRVTNLKNGQSVTVRINDRGPFTRGRVIDISESAAEIIGIKRSGVGKVRLEILAAAKPETDN